MPDGEPSRYKASLMKAAACISRRDVGMTREPSHIRGEDNASYQARDALAVAFTGKQSGSIRRMRSTRKISSQDPCHQSASPLVSCT
jgi:hypothetical protein